MDRKYDLEESLINFCEGMIKTAEKLPKSFADNHLTGQFVRSGTAPALHYGEALSAESRNDFIHKMRIALKELRETYNCLKITHRIKWLEDEMFMLHLQERNELVSIFVKSINTAQKIGNQQNLNKFNIQNSLINIHDL